MLQFSINTIERLCYLGLGLVAGLEAQVGAVASEAEAVYRDLVARGAQDNSEMAQSLRHRLDDSLLTVQDLRQRVVGLALS